MYCAPVASANRKVEQAAFISKLKALVMPTPLEMMLAVAGNSKSGVVVAQISNSTSSGLVPVLSSSCCTALMPITDEPWSTPFKMRRSRMPVRESIHSLLVSTNCSNSALVST